ncbi:calsyntenin-1-like [Limulus polyphemus]|uniref:Calsyntenin-1-like n=1 Tax=Limulus polyphemus TaxID=6850 RepID=A0ABM1S6H7_LIMPO|nr:calsyntenin-1-like [Limulus polyphemus]
MRYSSGIILLLLSCVFATEKLVPHFDNVNPEVGYHAIVKENEKTVEVTPRIRVVNVEPVRFLVTSKHHGEVPFRVQITDPRQGDAILVAEKSLNCEKRKSYKFEIAAVGRNGEVSENVTVHLTVEDVNEYSPVFPHGPYIVDVDEKRLYDTIIQVKAEDRDCTPKYSDICKYEILTPDQPFTIDSEGRIKNTEPLSREQSHNHILRVVAFDCGMKRSKPINVNVKVNKVCRLGWKGASTESVDLLPTPELGASWTRNVPMDDGHESDQIYQFDGATSVVVPETVLNHNLTNNFTVAFWMKHERYPEPNHTSHHMKEHIICNADDHVHNRHHYSIFIRNCKLILLLRREFYQGADRVHNYELILRQILYFNHKPAYYLNRAFKLVCSELNSRFISNEYMQTELTTNSKKTQVTIEGESQENLEKLMSEIMYLNTREFPTPGHRNLYIDTDVTCSNGKRQKVPEIRSYVMVLKPDQPRISINGTSNLAREYEAFKQGIELFNTISLTVNQHHEEEFSDVVVNMDYKLDKCSVQVYPPLNPDHEYFQLPENLLMHLGIHHRDNKGGLIIYGESEQLEFQMNERKANKTAFHFRGYLAGLSLLRGQTENPDVLSCLYQCKESLEEPLTDLLESGMAALYVDGHVFSASVNNPEIIDDWPLHSIKDVNSVFTLTVIHPRAEPSHEIENQLNPVSFAHAQVNQHMVDSQVPQVKSDNMNDKHLDSGETVTKTSASNAMTIIIVVCVGFLVFMIVLGVIRIRAAHHQSQDSRDDEQEMAWDDTSLTITVNPMDQILEQKETQPVQEDDDSDSDDGSNYHDGESSEEETEKVKERELEWDDSNMSF